MGFGDAITLRPNDAVYPVLLDDFPAPKLRTYPTYTVVAEKLHAIAVLGMTNTRLKDYFDLSVLLARESLDLPTLAAAVSATFRRRGAELPDEVPIGLSDEFAFDPTRAGLWRAFLKKNDLAPQALAGVVTVLREALWPALSLARTFQSDSQL